MTKKNSNIKKRFRFFEDTSFFQRMILIYVIGGIIPLLGATMYTNSQTRNMMIDVHKETQSEELSLIVTSIQESMSVMEDVSRLLSESKEIKNLATGKYSNKIDFLKEYYKIKSISEYLNYYQQDISYINIYLNNETIDPQTMLETKYISYLGETVEKKNWYKKTLLSGKNGYWYYGTSPASREKLIQITRRVMDDEGNVVAVVAVLMQNRKTEIAIDKRSTDTMLMFNNSSIISSNYDAENKYPFLRGRLSSADAQSFSEKMVYGIEEYQVTYKKVKTTNIYNHYSLVSVQNYQDIMSKVNRISFQAFLPEILGIIASMILISAFSISYGRRMNQISQQMHYVAQGEYDKVVPIEGHDEIGKLYEDLEQMMKDIQKLMADVVEEQVQKEKLHTRQKEVEFKMLASQINPHFLYNTLETIRMKAMVNKQPEIADLVKMLAKTMRYNIQVTDQLVNLKAELQMVEYYLKIQNYRFGDRITSEVIISPEIDRNALVMPLLIQPFVENAFIHGLEAKDRDGRLTVRVAMAEEDIEIEIIDNGVGMDYYELGRLRKSLHEENNDQTHIGVHNVNQRIKILYGENYGVRIESKKEEGTKVIITIPYQLEEEVP